jgi:hypothetical protein
MPTRMVRTLSKMNVSRNCIARRLVIAAAICSLLVFSGNLAAQQKAGSEKNQLIGTWMLVSAQNEKKADVFGPHPSGMVVFDSTGHFTSQVLRSDLPKFASPNRTKATPEESQAVIRGYIAYFGTYKITGPGEITLHIISGSFPNWDGAEQKRLFVIKGDELQYTNMSTSFGDASAHLVWKRVR